MKTDMKKFILLLTLLSLVSCGTRTEAPGYIVQVSQGGWYSPDYAAEQLMEQLHLTSRPFRESANRLKLRLN